MAVSSSVAGESAASTGRTYLASPERNTQFLHQGYAVVEGVLSPREVTELTSSYLDLAPVDDHGLTIDYLREDRDLVRELTALLTPVWDEHLDEIMVDHRVVMTTFVVKHRGQASEMFLHEDRSFVDERVDRAATIWMPLCDVGPDIANGGLELVPGSHRLPAGWSGVGTPDVIRPWEPELRRALVPVSLAAGSAVVYDTRTLHASGWNRTDEPRIAVACAVAPRSSGLVFVLASGRRHRLLHEVTEDFYLEQHPWDLASGLPESCPLREEFDEEPELSASDIEAVIGMPVVGGPVVPIPPDVRRPTDLESLLPFPERTVAVDLPDRDVAVDLTGRPSSAGGGRVPVLEPVDDAALHTVPLVDRLRPVPHADDRFGDPRSLVTNRFARDVELVVVDPGARVVVSSPNCGRWNTELVTLEAPVVGAGVRDDDHAAALRPGVAVTVPQATPLQLWNDGPAQLVLVAARVPAEHGVIGRVLSVFGRRR